MANPSGARPPGDRPSGGTTALWFTDQVDGGGIRVEVERDGSVGAALERYARSRRIDFGPTSKGWKFRWRGAALPLHCEDSVEKVFGPDDGVVVDVFFDSEENARGKENAWSGSGLASSICCDGCGKWRLLPPSMPKDSAKNKEDKWYCKDNIYDKDRSNCNAEERPTWWMTSYFDHRANEGGVYRRPQVSAAARRRARARKEKSFTIFFEEQDLRHGENGMLEPISIEAKASWLLRRVFLSFADSQNMPLGSFEFQYKENNLSMTDGKTVGQLGIVDGQSIRWSQNQVAAANTDAFGPITIGFKCVFSLEMKAPSHSSAPCLQIRRDCSISSALQNYSQWKTKPLDDLRFWHHGKLVPGDLEENLAQLKIDDCDYIWVDQALSEGEIFLYFLRPHRIAKVAAKLDSPIDRVIRKYCTQNNLQMDNSKFIIPNGEVVIPRDCQDTVDQYGLRNHHGIVVHESMDIEIKNWTDTPGRIACMGSSPISEIFELCSKLSGLSKDRLLFTVRGADIAGDSKEQLSTLGLKTGDTIHVAKRATDQLLSNKAFKTMFYMSGSIDNPSFKPIVQVIDIVEARHRNNWNLIISDGQLYIHAECTPKLSHLFKKTSVGDIFQVHGFVIKKGNWRNKTCQLTNAELFGKAAKVGKPISLQPQVNFNCPVFCHNCKALDDTALLCQECSFVCYCSKDCQLQSWKNDHKRYCPIYKAYYAVCKEVGFTSLERVQFWIVALFDLTKDEALNQNFIPMERDCARLSNYLLHLSSQNRMEFGHPRMLKMHITSSSLLRQICTTGLGRIACDYKKQDFLDDLPYLKAGVDASESSTMSMIDSYLEQYGAHDTDIIGSETVEGAVLVKVVFDSPLDRDFEQLYELETNLGLVVERLGFIRVWRIGQFENVRFTLNAETLLNPMKKNVTWSKLGMQSRGICTIYVTRLSTQEQKANSCIVDFLWQCHKRRKATKIVARNVIADFAWRVCGRQRASRAINDFVWHHHQRRKVQKTKCATSIQRVSRGYLARKLPLFNHAHDFYEVWREAISQAPNSPVGSLSGWALAMENIDLKRLDALDEDGDLIERDDTLSRALTCALQDDNGEEVAVTDGSVADAGKVILNGNAEDAAENSLTVDWSQFLVTSHVVKFIRSGDSKYREIFIKRMRQLAKGERSHKLQKPLKGCSSVIYESYLENKHGGLRILWTQEAESSIVVWFIAKHKSVSRLARLIDDAKNRTARQQLPQGFLSELKNDGFAHQMNRKSEVLLDALGNTPLKLYDVNISNIDEVASPTWSPQMHLTDDERKVVEAKGTTLLLGRSGTGKTVCICNRIEFDRQRLGHKNGFTQLFISRSSRLCKYVQTVTGINAACSFLTFGKLVRQLDSLLPQTEERQKMFRSESHVDFARFRQGFFVQLNTQERVSALICWRAIRSFLKGSIEAYRSPTSVLAKEMFVSEKLGKNRCKIPQHLRVTIYDIFSRYQLWLRENRLWDDCELIVGLLKRAEVAKKSDPVLYEEKIKRSKIYVDEVQDYTQLEILLFFYISGGPGSLFLAGDPAQSVVEGTDFRFEEIRSVGYFVAGKLRHLIPEKPKIVNVNFRSHSGILNCAGGFLDLLFQYFPGSAKELKKDFGLFKGARPGVFSNVEVNQLSSLLREKMQGAVVLTHDDSAQHWSDALGSKLVYGIRESKGLEFKSVIVLNFFGELPSTFQKPWRDLLLGRAGTNFGLCYPLVENYLKLMYVAVTRCIEQLFFAETSPSIAGDAAIRWLTSPTKQTGQEDWDALATRNSVENIDSMAMTLDEFCVAGINNAALAESSEIEPAEAIIYLDRAIYCFERAQNQDLEAKAKTHQLSVQFRLEKSHEKSSSEGVIENIEWETAELVESLLRHCLYMECLNLLKFITPFISSFSVDMLEKKIVRSLKLALDL